MHTGPIKGGMLCVIMTNISLLFVFAKTANKTANKFEINYIEPENTLYYSSQMLCSSNLNRPE